jgi:prepilin-type processing-associated H-X9-DG protein
MEQIDIGLLGRPGTLRRPIRGLVLGVILVLMASSDAARGQGARSSAGTDAGAGPMARFVPRQDLIFYLQFDGLDAHAATWKKSAAYKLLNDTKLGALLKDMAAQAIDLAQQSVPPGKGARGAQVVEQLERIAREGFVCAVWGKVPNESRFVVVLRHADGPQISRLLDAAGSASAPEKAAEDARPASIARAGRTLHALGKDGVWWLEKGDLVLTGKDKADEILAVLDGKQPSALDHPLRTALARAEPGFEPAAIGFLDITALPPAPPDAAPLGIDGLKRVELRWGFQDDALRSVVRVVAPAPRRGLVSLLDQPTFDIGSLPSLPAGLTGFTALSVDLSATYDKIVTVATAASPQGADQVAAFEQSMHRLLGLELRNDLLQHLGPKVALYAQEAGAGAAGDPAAAMMAAYAGLTISFQVRNAAAVAKGLDPLMSALNRFIKQRQAGGRPDQANAGAPAPEFRKQPAVRPAYVLEFPPGSLPPQVAALFRPTVMLGTNQLVFGMTTNVAEQALTRGPRWQPTAAFSPVAQRLPQSLVFLNINDPRDSMPALIERLPALVQQWNATLLPAMQSGREAARRAQCTNNLKQIALAMMNYESANSKFPSPAITDKQGKPLLSWRVAILPYIDQQVLYQKFKLDEPWDSPHNQALLKEMPPSYRCPGRERVEPFTTTYQVFTGGGALFDSRRGLALADVTDGTSNTLMVVESKTEVPWTKPDDMPFNPATAPSNFVAGSPHPGGFNAAMADGSVRFFPMPINPRLFQALVTRAGGEVVIPDEIALKPGQLGRPREAAGLRVDPDKIPRADELSRLLFPASMALAVDGDGASIVIRESIPSVSSPATAGVLVAILLPAVQSAREAARRAQCVNNLKQIGLALHNYHAANNAFPSSAITDPKGKPLFSWRVAILPYIEQQGLYNRFKLDEPWDSPHNQALLKEMPSTYVCPSRARVEPFTTTYQVFTGGGALFESGRGVTLPGVTDGTSNTLMVVEAQNAVPWTKPDDMTFDPAAAPSLCGAGSSHPGGFNVLMADGAVRFIKNAIDLRVFRALITRAGGEVIGPDAF